MAVTRPPEQPADGSDTPDPGGGKTGGRRAPGPPASRRPPARSTVAVPAGVDSAAGLVLAVLVWSWIGLPLLRGGPGEVTRMWRAKWLNQAPDGTWLP